MEVSELPRVGDSFRIDYEGLNLLKPDLVLAWQSGNPSETLARLRDLNYHVVELEAAVLDDIADQIQLIGEYSDTAEAAALSAGQYRERLETLRQQYADAKRVRVFYQISAAPYFTVSFRHIINDAIRLCGGLNIFAELEGVASSMVPVAPSISLEAIIAANPDAIIASVSPGDEFWKEGWAKWGSIRAVETDNLYGISRDLISRPGPRIAQGVESICAALDEARGRL